MHIGTNNPCYEYTMNRQKLETSSEEKDEGVYINSNLKPSGQCTKAATNKTTAVLNQILRSFPYRDKYVYLRLFEQYVRPRLEFTLPLVTMDTGIN
jgi:hypothetical protein